MERLPNQFRYDGFTLTQIWRSDRWAIYEKRKESHTRSTFEVFRIRIRGPDIVFGKEYPEREFYPWNEEWGNDAWTAEDVAQAYDIIAREESRKSGSPV